MQEFELPDVAYLHRRAEQCRQLADNVLVADLRDKLLEAADDYDRMARRGWQEAPERRHASAKGRGISVLYPQAKP